MACLHPWLVKGKYGGPPVRVPCGRCVACLSSLRNQWAWRMEQEIKASCFTAFATLTYDDDHLPIDYSDETGAYATLVKSHVQKWVNRYRTALSRIGIGLRYYVCGEYGDNTYRPHYHAMLFYSVSDSSKLPQHFSFSADGYMICGFLDLASMFRASWIYGSVLDWQQSDTAGASMYCAKYVNKITFENCYNKEAQKPFSLKSNGLGSNYLTDQMIKWHSDFPDDRRFVYNSHGFKLTMPRYFKRKIYGVKPMYAHSALLISDQQIKQQDEDLRKAYSNYKLNHPSATYDQFVEHYDQPYEDWLNYYVKTKHSKHKL